MTSTRRSTNRAVKHESTHFGGLPTPNQSMSSNAGTITLKDEIIDFTSEDSSDTAEAPLFINKSNHGLPVIEDEGYATQAAERKLRSASPSLANSFQILPSRAATPQHPNLFQAGISRSSIAPSIASMAVHIPGASLQIVGEKVNLLVNAIQELRKLGLKEIDTELPELVLVGDQSAGKSSLMGAIAEINLPKDNGMCTRCPANIKTSPAETWSCSVSLHIYYQHSKAVPHPTHSSPFHPWSELDNKGLRINAFTTIRNKAELENVLRWAQIALLNPSQDFHLFIPGRGTVAQNGLESGHQNESDFSPNIVAIEISGPGLPALSFYDLPGIFATSSKKEEDYLIRTFENLATKYIKHENALVICAITMANDPGVSTTSNIIKKCKAEKRTIGVLTMPDRLQQGKAHDDYDAIFHEKKYVLPRGYFVTKQPGPTFVQLPGKDYHRQAREQEKAFFDTDSYWTGQWKEFRDRCGTEAIQSYLSQEFARFILKSMPSIDEKIRRQAQSVDTQLSDLPEPPFENAQHVVRSCLQEFSNGVVNLLDGGSSSNGFLSRWSQLSEDFADIVQKMKPMFVFTDPSDRRLPVIDLDGDSSSEMGDSIIPSPTPHLKRPHDSPSTPQAKRQLNNDGSSIRSGSATPFAPNSSNGSSFTRPKREEGSFGSPSPLPRIRPPPPPGRTARKTPFDEFLGAGKKFMTIAEVHEVISSHRRPGHPDNVSAEAREDICLMAVALWKRPLERLAEETFTLLRSSVLDVLESPRTLGKYQQTDLFRKSKRHILKFLETHQNKQRVLLQSFYELESYKLFTVNNEAFMRYKNEELILLQGKRREHRVRCHVNKWAFLNKKPVSDAQRPAAEKAVTDEQLGPDPFALEIETAAFVRGYYRTAGSRFADNICQSLWGNLFKNIKEEIKFLLEKHLELDTGDCDMTCRNLMVEDHGEAAQRVALQEEKVKLNRAAERLARLVQDLDITPDEPEDRMDMDEEKPHGYHPARAESHFDPENYDE